METTELITADELAERLRVRPGTIRRWTCEGIIPAVRISRKVIRYNPTHVVTTLGDRPTARAERLRTLAHELDAEGYTELASKAREFADKFSQRREP